MTLHPQKQWTIPAETVRVAEAAFPKGNIYMAMYEQLGQLYRRRRLSTTLPSSLWTISSIPS